MASGKTIELFLRDGSFNGVVEGEIHGYNIKCYKVGRDDSEIDSVPELKNPGVYLLFCGGPSDGVYIGESGDVHRRLKDHKRDYNSGKEKYFWTEALCFVDSSLSIITKYCEARLVEEAISAKTYTMLTKASGIPPIKSSAKSDMENFIEHVMTLVGTFGKNVFTNNAAIAASTPSKTYHIKRAGLTANMVLTKAGFVVLAGSQLASTVSKSMPKNLLDLRNDLIKKGIIDTSFTLTKDQVFGSVSAAAKFVTASSTKGTLDWLDSSNIPIGNKTI